MRTPDQPRATAVILPRPIELSDWRFARVFVYASENLEPDRRLEVKEAPDGGALMCLLFRQPEGEAEQGLRSRARPYARMDP